MAGTVTPWWPLQWENPPAGSNYCDVTLANGKRFRVHDDQGRRKRDGVFLKSGRFVFNNNHEPVIRYEIRQILGGFASSRLSPKYIRAETLLEVRAYLTAEEQTADLLGE